MHGEIMADVLKTVLIGQSAERMFDLVTDVEKYPEFLPWCGGVEMMLAKLNFA